MKKTRCELKDMYVSPSIKMIDVIIEQNILANGSADSNLNDMSGEIW